MDLYIRIAECWGGVKTYEWYTKQLIRVVYSNGNKLEVGELRYATMLEF